MKRAIYILSTIVLIGAGYFVYQKFFSTSSLGERVFNDIENGKIYYAPTMNGSIFLDLDNMTTNILTKHILLSSGTVPTAEAIIDFNSQVFQIPKSIRKHEFIKSSTDNASYLTDFNLSESDYNEIWQSFYKTYQNFVEQNLKLYSKENSFRYDTLNRQIIYRKKTTNETRLKYKVETATENFLTELVFVDVDGSKKLAAIFSTKN